MEHIRRKIQEVVVPDRRLGRHINHDPRNRDFGIKARFAGRIELRDIVYHRHVGIFDQGNLGSCTGNAAVGAVDTDPLFGKHIKYRLYEPTAQKIYSLATTLDPFDGTYPPTDTGSSGLAAAAACKKRGFIGAYHWAFGIDEACQALMIAPVITGVNWFESMDFPNQDGKVEVAGDVRGGHEFLIRQYITMKTGSYLDDWVGCDNSWTAKWGKMGRFFMTVRSWATLLDQQGDVTVLLP
jgi:hypothetical protein